VNGEKIVVVANETPLGISVIDIQFYNSSGRISGQSPRRLIHDINELPLLDRKKIKLLVARSYGIPIDSIYFQ
jgi:hypothetical protein